MNFKGVYTALITPFLDDGLIDFEGLVKLIELQGRAGISGIAVLGTTGESSTLERAERLEVVKTAVKSSSIPVLVGTGANSTRMTIEYTLEAEALGASAALIVAPYYNRPTQEGLFRHFEAVHAATSLPIMLYNNPSRCGVNILPETVRRLASLERIKGIKEASGSLLQMSEIIEIMRKERPEFAVLTGDDSSILPAASLGALGVVSVMSNLLPAEIKAFVNACLENRSEEARDQHYRLMPIIRALFAETNPILVKEGMKILGLPAGPCRGPLCGGSNEGVERLHKALSCVMV